ncbi:unnamed protein product, partial [Rotaria sp. Silwood2]
MLTTNSPVFYRINGYDLCYFQAIQVTVPISGSYSFKSDSFLDAYGYLYANTFDPSNPKANVLIEDDDTGGYQQFLINYWMQYGYTYVLVFTTYSPRVTGTFSIVASGPARVNLKYLHVMPLSTTTVF